MMYECEFCGKLFDRETRLAAHQWKKHRDEMMPKPGEEEEE